MKAVVMKGPKTSLVVNKEIELKPKDDEILIQIKYVGVCMSEHYDWSTAKEGDTFGHEPMGIIKEVGKDVEGYSVGDRVSGLWGSTLPGAGGLVEYQIVKPKESTILKIADNIRDEDAVLEPLACIVSAVSKVDKGVPGDPVLVVGCGFMGCGSISLLKTSGAYVIAVDIREESRKDALRFGADEVYSPEEALAKFAPKEKDVLDTGLKIVMEWGGTEESLDLAINLTAMCGQLCVGGYHTGGKRLVDMQQLNVKAIECLSVHPREADLNSISVKNAMKLLANGEWKFTNVPVKIYPRDKFDQANEELETKYGKYMKALIDMTEEGFEPYILD